MTIASMPRNILLQIYAEKEGKNIRAQRNTPYNMEIINNWTAAHLHDELKQIGMMTTASMPCNILLQIYAEKEDKNTRDSPTGRITTT